MLQLLQGLEFFQHAIELDLECLDEREICVKGKAVGDAFMAFSHNADGSPGFLLQGLERRSPELAAGDLLHTNRFGGNVEIHELIGEEVVLQQIESRLCVGCEDIGELGEDPLQEGADAGPGVCEIVAQLVMGDCQLMHGIGVGTERLVGVEGTPLSDGGHEKGILGIGVGELQIHDGPGMMGAQGRDQQDCEALAVEVEGKRVPQVA